MLRSFGVVVALVLATILRSSATMPTIAVDDQIETTLEVSGDWVIGLPLWVAVTVKTPQHRGVTIGKQRQYPFYAPTHRLVLRVLGSEDDVLTERTFRAPSNPTAQLVHVEPGGATRLLFLLEGDSLLKPGSYELFLYLQTDGGEDLAAPAIGTVTVRRPTREEEVVLGALSLDPSKPWWFWFERGRREELRSLRIPDSLRHAVGFDLLLRRLLDSGDCEEYRRCDLGLHDLQPEDVLVTDTKEFFAPERAALRHEILRSKHRVEEAEALREVSIETWPGIAWLFDLPPGSRPLLKGRSLQRYVHDRLRTDRARDKHIQPRMPAK